MSFCSCVIILSIGLSIVYPIVVKNPDCSTGPDRSGNFMLNFDKKKPRKGPFQTFSERAAIQLIGSRTAHTTPPCRGLLKQFLSKEVAFTAP